MGWRLRLAFAVSPPDDSNTGLKESHYLLMRCSYCLMYSSGQQIRHLSRIYFRCADHCCA